MTPPAEMRAEVISRLERHVRNAKYLSGARAGRVLVAIGGIRVIPERLRILLPRRIAQFAIASGGGPFITGLVSRLSTCDIAGYRELAHELLLGIGEVDEAEKIAATSGPERWQSIDTQRLLETDRHFARGDAAAAAATLRAVRPSFSSAQSARLTQAMMRTGEVADTLAFLDSYDHNLGPTSEAIVRFDAYWQLGDLDAARAQVDDLVDGQLANLALIQRLHTAYRASGLTSDHALDRVLALADAQPRRRDVDWLISVYFVFNRLDELVEFTSQPSVAARMEPTGRYTLAAAHYVRRDFAAARALLPGLLGTLRHWDAEKLESRILLEEGRYTEALDNRLERSRLRPALDEVLYFARLHLGQLREGFRIYLHDHDARRLTSEFGARADLLPTERVNRRFVIPQDGPGDEIALAATYAQLLDSADELAAACDPRLLTLLQRSFPRVDFIPSARQPSRPALGFVAAGRPARSTGNMFDLLTAEAYDRAQSSDRVSLGRSLMRISPDAAPYDAYVRPDADRVARTAARIGPNAIGLAWRSEYVDPMRSIHFVTPSELEPLAALDATFVCAQHDVSDLEREQLREAFGQRITYLDDLDLRDDFEEMAALAAACRAVVGVGTTFIELAGAVGTPTIFLHPTLIGTWRRRDDGVSDYWHESIRVACVERATERDRCVTRAVDLLVAEGIGLRRE